MSINNPYLHSGAPRTDQEFWAKVGDHWCQGCGQKNPPEIENLNNYLEIGHLILDQDHDPNCDGSCSHCPIQVVRLCGPLRPNRPPGLLICERCTKRMDAPAFLGDELLCIFCFTSTPLTSSQRSGRVGPDADALSKMRKVESHSEHGRGF